MWVVSSSPRDTFCQPWPLKALVYAQLEAGARLLGRMDFHCTRTCAHARTHTSPCSLPSLLGRVGCLLAAVLCPQPRWLARDGGTNSHLAPSFLSSVVPEAHGLPHFLGTSLMALTPATALVRQPQLRAGRSLCGAWRGGVRAQPSALALFPAHGLSLGKAFLYPGPWSVPV